ncbi:hypothetical protein NLU13_7698 [Sarocladium strictum]|uniref:Semialdehyde dehydrogenase NAD-binding domain-containing protein n=1 Tax=Sarocladium strictum TaxID=5046 RepID=A0AA39GDL1_SARSR|nr:hypothetical protein NLU13_7698 [Sarocladium strictum]
MFSPASVAVRAGSRRVSGPSSLTALHQTRTARNACSFSTARSSSIYIGRSRPLQPTAPWETRARHGYATTTNPNPPFGKKNASNDKPSRIGLIGGRGFTGQAMIELFEAHPYMDLKYVSSREIAGQELEGYTKRKLVYEHLSPEEAAELERDGEVDCWVMALPNGVCKRYVEAIDQVQKTSGGKSIIVDLSADYRLDSAWTYGLPELTPREVESATRLSTPGCYATAAELGITPLLEHLGGEPVIFAVSGYSGAGTKPNPRNDVKLLENNMIPYSLTGHTQEQEISHHLGTSVSFIPHVASWFRGIHLTINIPLNKQIASRDLRQIFQDRYAGEKLVKVVGEAPHVKSVSSAHRCEIGGFSVDSTGKRVVVCASLDNLNKGAATQCLQSMNLALGYAEYEGIPV